MKAMKRIFAMLLALVMTLGMVTTAFAVEGDPTGTGSITINDSIEGKTYDLYRIFDLTMTTDATGKDKVAYTIAESWKAFFAAEGDGASYLLDSDESGALNQIVVDGTEKYINITNSNIDAFAEAALGYAAKKTADETVSGNGEDVTASNLKLGYYLVYPRGAADIKVGNGSICSLTSTVPNVTVSIKAEYPEIEKEVSDELVEIGQTVTYTITGQVPDTTGYETYNYTVSDTMYEGLTFNQNDGVAVKIDPDGTAVDVPVSPTYTNNGFNLTIDMTDYQSYIGKTVTITYTATVNENAIIGGEGNSNKAVLTYSNNPSNDTSTTQNPPVEVKVYTAKIVIDKYDGNVSDKTEKLENAKFVLKNSDGKYYKATTDAVTGKVTKVEWIETGADGSIPNDATEVTTDASGAAEFTGLEPGTYYLVETAAPAGYNKLTDAVTVTIDESQVKDDDTDTSESTETATGTITADVPNYSGTVLPTTGGMGTTVFYVIGSVLVLGAAVLLITRRRMRAMK